MATQKIVSNSVLKAQENKEKAVKTATVRIIDNAPILPANQHHGDIKSTVMVNGVFAKAGDLIEVLEDEAADLISRGHAELVSK